MSPSGSECRLRIGMDHVVSPPDLRKVKEDTEVMGLLNKIQGVKVLKSTQCDINLKFLTFVFM